AVTTGALGAVCGGGDRDFYRFTVDGNQDLEVIVTFTAGAETDLELSDPVLGQVLHVDTTAILRAGVELVTFGDTSNAFDLLQGVIEDLANEQGLDQPELNT
uniref:hypothetical protein n=1 Tax=Acinetobacter baumannii TaxID=470 RepID=UPI00339666CA